MTPNRFLAAGATACVAAVVVFATAMGIMQNNDMTARRSIASLPPMEVSVPFLMVHADRMDVGTKVSLRGVHVHCFAQNQCAVAGRGDDPTAQPLATLFLHGNLPDADAFRLLECNMDSDGCTADISGQIAAGWVSKFGNKVDQNLLVVTQVTWATASPY